MSQPAAPFNPDPVWDRYPLHQLGSSALGSLHQGVTPQQERILVRRLAWALPDSDPQRQILEQETRLAVQLADHAHMARILDWGWDLQGYPYWVMAAPAAGTLVTLAEGLAQGLRYDLKQAVGLAHQLASVLHAAHRLRPTSLCHRYLSPASVLLAPEAEQVYLIDWGSGIAIDPTLRSENSNPRLDPLRPYLAPEVLRGEPAHLRSDVYSLGAILAQLLVGQVLQGDPIKAFLGVKTLWGDSVLPDGIKALIAACLSEDPSLRPHSMEAFSHRLTLAAGLASPQAKIPALSVDNDPKAPETAISEPESLEPEASVGFGDTTVDLSSPEVAAGSATGSLDTQPDGYPYPSPRPLPSPPYPPYPPRSAAPSQSASPSSVPVLLGVLILALGIPMAVGFLGVRWWQSRTPPGTTVETGSSTIVILAPEEEQALRDQLGQQRIRAIQARDWPAAIAVVDQMIAQFPNEAPALTRYRQELERNLTDPDLLPQLEPLAQIQSIYVGGIEQAIQERDWGRAQRILDILQQQYPAQSRQWTLWQETLNQLGNAPDEEAVLDWLNRLQQVYPQLAESLQRAQTPPATPTPSPSPSPSPTPSPSPPPTPTPVPQLFQPATPLPPTPTATATPPPPPPLPTPDPNATPDLTFVCRLQPSLSICRQLSNP